MVVKVSTTLMASAEAVWNLVEKSSTLIEVAWPLARIEAVDGKFPERWSEGSLCRCRSFVFGFLPVGHREIYFEKMDALSKRLQSRESDSLIKRWDHLISVDPLDGGGCIYTDEVEIDAGPLTPVIWVWAIWFYHHRQNRWHKLIKNDQDG